jgi:hypothetical protein
MEKIGKIAFWIMVICFPFKVYYEAKHIKELYNSIYS